MECISVEIHSNKYFFSLKLKWSFLTLPVELAYYTFNTFSHFKWFFKNLFYITYNMHNIKFLQNLQLKDGI